MKLMLASMIVGCVGLSASTTHAGLGILAGGPSTAIYANQPGGTQFQAVSACTGQIDSMINWGGYLLAGSKDGGIYRFQLTGFFPVMLVGNFDLPGDAACLAMDGNVLLVGDSTTQTVRRVNPITGEILSSFKLPNQFPASLHAMLVHDGKLYVGGHTTAVYKGNTDGTGMNFFTLCGGQVDSMTIADGSIFLGTTGGNLYRLDPSSGNYQNVFSMPKPQTALVTDLDGTILSSSSDGSILRINPTNGKVIETLALSSPDDIQALALFDGNVFCSADVDNDGALSIDDFIAFHTLFAIGDPSADFDMNGVLSVDDFIAYQGTFAIGCSL